MFRTSRGEGGGTERGEFLTTDSTTVAEMAHGQMALNVGLKGWGGVTYGGWLVERDPPSFLYGVAGWRDEERVFLPPMAPITVMRNGNGGGILNLSEIYP